jgi:5-aminolevulinate synthase
MCPAVAAGSLESIKQVKKIKNSEILFLKMLTMSKKNYVNLEIPFLDSGSHIIPVLIGDSKLCKEISDFLLNEHQVYVQPINYPTVPKGTERIRITPTPCHSKTLLRSL